MWFFLEMFVAGSYIISSVLEMKHLANMCS